MNPFQAQFPLSPRKFWKKFLPTIIPSVLLSAILVFLFLAVLAALNKLDTVSSALSLGIGLLLVFTIAILGMYAWYFKAYIRTYFYEGGDNFMTIRKGVFAPREIHIQYQKIQDVYVDQDLLDRVMGLYDVHIASATVASGMEAHIDGVEAVEAEGLKQFFLAKIQGSSMQPPSAMPNMQGGAPAPTAPVAAFNGNISSDTYPLQPAWMTKSIVSVLFSSVLFGFFASLYIWAKTADGQLFSVSFLPTFLAVTVVWFIFHIIGVLLWKKNYRFAFMPEYIQYHTGILSESERHLPYKSIQDVNMTRPLIDRMFGLANVTIENAAQMAMVGNRAMPNNIMIVGLTPTQANEITEALKAVILTKNSSQMGL